MRIHVPCCFTMEEKQRPPQPGADTARRITWALPWRGWAVAWGVEGGDGEREQCVCYCLRLCWSVKEIAQLILLYMMFELMEISCRLRCVLNILACVEGEGLWSVTLRQRRGELGSFKLDLDSPGDMSHCISPLGQTWTRWSSLTVARFDRQKMGEHFPMGLAWTLLLPPQNPCPLPEHLLPILLSWLKLA